MKKLQLALCVLALAAHPALATEEDGPGMAAEPASGMAAEPASELEESAPVEGAEAPSGRVARASFTTAVVDREPEDSVTRLPNDATEIHFFTELQGLTGHTLTHVWKRDGVVVARVPFPVHGPRWRVHSTKSLQPAWLGEWTVTVMDENENVLGTERFELVAAEAAPVAKATPAAEAAPAAPPAKAAPPAIPAPPAPAAKATSPAPPAKAAPAASPAPTAMPAVPKVEAAPTAKPEPAATPEEEEALIRFDERYRK